MLVSTSRSVVKSKRTEDSVIKYRKVPGRKILVNPTFVPKLRVLKSDIRRTFVAMFMNVRNSHDAQFTRSFLEFVCLPDCTYRLDFPHEVSPASISNFGTGNIVDFLSDFAIKMPDSTMIIDNVRIRVTLGESGSRIEGNFRFTGTKLYERLAKTRYGIFSVPELPSLRSTQVEPVVESIVNGQCGFSLMSLQNSVEYARCDRYLTPHPSEICSTGDMVVVLDENNRVKEWTFTSTNFIERKYPLQI